MAADLSFSVATNTSSRFLFLSLFLSFLSTEYYQIHVTLEKHTVYQRLLLSWHTRNCPDLSQKLKPLFPLSYRSFPRILPASAQVGAPESHSWLVPTAQLHKLNDRHA